MSMSLLSEAKELQGYLTDLRRELHRVPEIGTKTPRTMKIIMRELDKIGISYKYYEDCSGIVATIGHGGRCFLLRADCDALPVTEESGVDFCSTIPGCMHACGHDLHTAMLIGAARLLKAHEGELKGTVKLMFQSGEEEFSGSVPLIEHGLLEDPHVDAAFAMHVCSTLPFGTMAYGRYVLSAVYGFRFTLTGKGCHGSMPDLGIDPINTGVHIYLGLQELIAREVSPQEEAVLTIGHFSAGSVPNVVPESAVLEGTLRTFKPEITEYLRGRVDEVARGIAATYRTKLDIDVLSKVPATICDMDLNREAEKSISAVDPDMKITPTFHSMPSEDFAYVSEKVPSAYFYVGAGVPDKSLWRPQHNAKVLFNEEVLHHGAVAHASVAIDWLNRHQ